MTTLHIDGAMTEERNLIIDFIIWQANTEVTARLSGVN